MRRAHGRGSVLTVYDAWALPTPGDPDDLPHLGIHPALLRSFGRECRENAERRAAP